MTSDLRTAYECLAAVGGCGMALGSGLTMSILEAAGVLRWKRRLAPTVPAQAVIEAVEASRAERPATFKGPKRRTPWRKVRAAYEARHRQTRESVEERVREMEGNNG